MNLGPGNSRMHGSLRRRHCVRPTPTSEELGVIPNHSCTTIAGICIIAVFTHADEEGQTLMGPTLDEAHPPHRPEHFQLSLQLGINCQDIGAEAMPLVLVWSSAKIGA